MQLLQVSFVLFSPPAHIDRSVPDCPASLTENSSHSASHSVIQCSVNHSGVLTIHFYPILEERVPRLCLLFAMHFNVQIRSMKTSAILAPLMALRALAGKNMDCGGAEACGVVTIESGFGPGGTPYHHNSSNVHGTVALCSPPKIRHFHLSR